MIKYEVTIEDDCTNWYINGKLHREDKPAVEYTDGHKFWYEHGKLHRTDGPAIEYAHGDKFWYDHGKLHRTDGPAIENADSTKYWFIDDQQLIEQEFNARTAPYASKTVVIDGVTYKLVPC